MSVAITYASPEEAYFVLWTRMWEFAVGALVCFGRFRPLKEKIILSLQLSGVGLIAYAALFLNSESYFPGYIALIPTLGAALIIFSTVESQRAKASKYITIKPVQLVGDLSYLIYLWHWPIIIALPYLLNAELGLLLKLLVIALTFLLSLLTKKFIEDPFRSKISIISKTSNSYKFMIAGIAIISLFSFWGWNTVHQENLSLQAEIDKEIIDSLENSQPQNCFGPNALVNLTYCQNIFGEKLLTDPEFAIQDIGVGLDRGNCHQNANSSELLICDYGELDNPNRVIALVGDSHARHWTDGLALYSKTMGWKLKVMTMSSCPGLPLTATAALEMPNCELWGQNAFDYLMNSTEISLVLYAQYSDFAPIDIEKSRSQLETFYAQGKQVMLFKDNPMREGYGTAPSCIEKLDDISHAYECSIPQDIAISVNQNFEKIASMSDHFPIIDLTEYFCSDGKCHSLIGGVIVYHDDHHLTGTYSKALAPFIGAKIQANLAR